MSTTAATTTAKRKPWMMDAPPARPAQRDKVITLDLDAAERLFLLFRMRHVREVADAILARADSYQTTWTRDQVVGRIRVTATFLSEMHRSMLVMGTLTTAVLQDGMENNNYFAQMVDDDPRFCVAAIRRVELLRLRMQRTLKVSIVPLFLGDRRGRSLEVVREGLRV